MKKQISRYILILLIIVFTIMLGVLIYIQFFSSSKAEGYAILKEKAEGEIIYLDSTIVELLNKLNNISFSRYNVTIKQINENEQQSSSNSNSGSSTQSDSKGEGEGENSESSSNDTGSATEVTNQSESKKSKLSQVDSLLNSDYNNISWEEISYGVETLYTAWPTINIDMKSLNVHDEDINSFSTALDGAAQSIKMQDKNNTLINLYNLYALLPKFLSYFSNDETKLNLYYTKAYVLSAYVSANKDKWSEMNNSISQAINTLSIVKNNSNITDSEKSNLDKSFVLLQDLQRGINIEDKEIFYLKYKLAMEELEIL